MNVYLVMLYQGGQYSGEDFEHTETLHAYLSQEKARAKVEELAKENGQVVNYDGAGNPCFSWMTSGDRGYADTTVNIDHMPLED